MSDNVFRWFRNQDASKLESMRGGYEIEQVWSPARKGYGWYVTGPDWDYGFVDSLTEAKAACERHHLELSLG